MKRPLLLVILGPTASGKSTLALKAAQVIGGEIVNCDSIQLYRRLEVGSAKPTAEEQQLIPHHLYSVVDPGEHYSAGRYMVEARRVCREISSRGRVPIVVGGAGLYLLALLYGFFEGPRRSDELHKRLQKIGRNKGVEYLHRMLKRKDPEAARRIPARDRIRMVRALEVYFLSGTPISRLQTGSIAARSGQQPLQDFHILKIGLNLPREILYARINARVVEMFHSGLVDEVKQLLSEGFSGDSKGLEALGYQHAIDYLNRKLTLEDAITLTARDTRRYAKRQMTWFRRDRDVHWINCPGESPEALQSSLDLVKETMG